MDWLWITTISDIPIIQAIALLFIALIVGKAASEVVKLMLRIVATRHGVDRSKYSLRRADWMIVAITFFIGLKFSLSRIINGDIEHTIQNILSTGLIVFVGYLVVAMIDFVIDVYVKPIVTKTKTTLDDQIVGWVHSASSVIVSALGVIYVMSIWGIEIAPVLASLGIAGLAVALALQPTLGNIFSGISLVLDKTFEVGDVIKLDTGEVGSVYVIGLRTTRIKTFDNEIIIVPNSVLANTRIQNFYQPDRKVRVNVEFGVEYGTDPEYVKRIVIDEITKIPDIDTEQGINVWFNAMADSALTFTARFWVDDISKKWVAQQEAMSRIYRRLYKEEIGIPFPQRTVWMFDGQKARVPNPKDKKFKSVHNKLYPKFGHPREPEKK